MKRNVYMVLVMLSLFLLSVNVSDAHRYTYRFNEIVSTSELILVGKILTVKKTSSGYKYASFVPKIYVKGEDRYVSKVIRYGDPIGYAQEDFSNLKKGKTYVMFLGSNTQYYYLVGADQGYYSIDNNEMVLHERNRIPLKEFIGEIRKAMEGDMKASSKPPK